MEISFNDGDNFIRNAVTIKCCGVAGAWSPLAQKLTKVGDGLPIPIEDLVLDLRVDSDEEEPTLERMERGACDYLEKRTGYVVAPGEYQVDLAGWWSGALEIMRGPLREVIAITYLDEDGVEQPADLSQFWVDQSARSFTILPLRAFTRPQLWSEVGRVRLTFTAGFALPDESDAGLRVMDDGLRTCLTMLVGHYYKNRELFEANKMETFETAGAGILGAYRQYW